MVTTWLHAQSLAPSGFAGICNQVTKFYQLIRKYSKYRLSKQKNDFLRVL